MPALRSSATAVASGLGGLLLAGALTACSGESVKQTVDVTLGNTACDLSSHNLQAGKTAFDIKNVSGKEAEAYVYNSDGDKVDEVEGIADGTSRTLTVSLDAGAYQFACKPEGNDVRTPFNVR